MPRFTVTAHEKFVVETTYKDVEAKDAEEAKEIVRRGDAAYDDHKIQEHGGEFLVIISVDQDEEVV